MTAATLTSHYAALASCIALTAAAQIFLKLGATASRSTLVSLVNPWTICGYGLFALVTVLSVYAMQRVDLKVVTAWTGLTYIFVMVASRMVLGELLTLTRIVGIILIAAGVVIFHV